MLTASLRAVGARSAALLRLGGQARGVHLVVVTHNATAPQRAGGRRGRGRPQAAAAAPDSEALPSEATSTVGNAFTQLGVDKRLVVSALLAAVAAPCLRRCRRRRPRAAHPSHHPLPPSSLQPFLEAQGIHEPMEIQRESVPAILAGENAALRCHTGSGKTLAYLLPALSLAVSRAEAEWEGVTRKTAAQAGTVQVGAGAERAAGEAGQHPPALGLPILGPPLDVLPCSRAALGPLPHRSARPWLAGNRGGALSGAGHADCAGGAGAAAGDGAARRAAGHRRRQHLAAAGSTQGARAGWWAERKNELVLDEARRGCCMQLAWLCRCSPCRRRRRRPRVALPPASLTAHPRHACASLQGCSATTCMTCRPCAPPPSCQTFKPFMVVGTPGRLAELSREGALTTHRCVQWGRGAGQEGRRECRPLFHPHMAGARGGTEGAARAGAARAAAGYRPAGLLLLLQSSRSATLGSPPTGRTPLLILDEVDQLLAPQVSAAAQTRRQRFDQT